MAHILWRPADRRADPVPAWTTPRCAPPRARPELAWRLDPDTGRPVGAWRIVRSARLSAQELGEVTHGRRK